MEISVSEYSRFKEILEKQSGILLGENKQYLVVSRLSSLLQEQGLDTVEANHALGFKADMRDYGIGIQILKDLGLREIRLLTNNPKKTEAFNLRGFDLRVVDQVPIVCETNPHNAAYMATKREKMGHQLPEE